MSVLSNSKIKKVVFTGTAQEVKALDLTKDILSKIAPAVRAEYFKKLQGKT